MIDYDEYVSGLSVMKCWFEEFYPELMLQMYDNTEHIIAPKLEDYKPLHYPFRRTNILCGGDVENLFTKAFKFKEQTCIIHPVNANFERLNALEQMFYECVPIFDDVCQVPWFNDEIHVLRTEYAPVLIGGSPNVMDVLSVSNTGKAKEDLENLNLALYIAAAYGADDVILVVNEYVYWRRLLAGLESKYQKLFEYIVIHDTQVKGDEQK